jgi:predicted nucleic acid-binding protein
MTGAIRGNSKSPGICSKRALAGEACVSSQVLAELTTVLIHKASPRADPGSVIAVAVQAHAKYNLHFYDGLIVAAAERGSGARISSEDMNSGQKYFGVQGRATCKFCLPDLAYASGLRFGV